MIKILITFLGTGPTIKDRKAGKYKTATYKIENKTMEPSGLVSEALDNYYNFDKIVVLGTMRSMWDVVYESFSKNTEQFSEDYLYEIIEWVESANHQTDPDASKLKSVNDNIERLHCVPIYYGLDEKEILANQEIIFKVIDSFEKEVELYIDVTHGFRSSPFYLFPAIEFGSELMGKKLKIKKILYGMFEVSDEMQGITPVVDITETYIMNDWIKGAYEFQNYGHLSKLIELLKSGKNKLSNNLEDLDNALFFNSYEDIEITRKRIEKFNIDDNTMVGKIINSQINDFKRLFVETSKWKKEIMLSKWHFKRKNYGLAYMNLTESIISGIKELELISENDWIKDNSKLKKIYLGKDNKEIDKKRIGDIGLYEKLRHIYSVIRKVRNMSAHVLTNEKKLDLSKFIKNYDSYSNTIEEELIRISKIKYIV